MPRLFALPGLDIEQVPQPGSSGADNECPECGREFDRASESAECDGETYCRRCVRICAACNNRSLDDDFVATCHVFSTGRRSSERVELCENCRRACHDCHESYRIIGGDCGIDTSAGWVCTACCASYSSCDACESIIHNDNLRAWTHDRDEDDDDDAGDGELLCPHCYDRRRRNARESIIHSYGYKPKPRFLVPKGQERLTGDPRTLFFGWEVEAEAGSGRRVEDDLLDVRANKSKIFYAKQDGSIHYGAEFVSHPGTYTFWQDWEFEFAARLSVKGWRGYNTDTCGMHVHISRSAMTALDIFKLCVFFKRESDLIYRLSRRKGWDALNSYAAIDDDTEREIAYKITKGRHDSRYVALNLCNRHTAEVRIFRSTLSPKGIKRNLALVYSWCRFVKQTGMKNLAAADYLAYLEKRGGRDLGKAQADNLLSWVHTVRSGRELAEAEA